MLELRDVTCHIGITWCYLPPNTSEHAPPEHQPECGTLFTYPRRMEGWVNVDGECVTVTSRLHTEMVYPYTGALPAVHGWELNLWPIDHMSSVLTTTVAGHHVYYLCVLCRLVLSMLYYHLTERCWPQQAKMAASGSLKLMWTPCPRQSTTFCLLYHCILWVYVGGLQVSQWPRGIDEETQRRLVQIKQVITKCTKENQNARCQWGNELQRLQNEYMQGQLTQGQLFVIPYIQFFWSYIRLGWFAHVYISIV